MLREGLIVYNPRPQAWRKRCQVSGKIRYMTERDADIAVARMGNTGSSYLCKCKSWHVTRQPRG